MGWLRGLAMPGKTEARKFFSSGPCSFRSSATAKHIKIRRPEYDPTAGVRGLEDPLVRRPAALVRNTGIGAGTGVDVLRGRIDHSACLDVGRNDAQSATTLPTEVGQAEFGLRDHRVRGRQGRRLTGQAAIVKRGE